MNQFLFSKSVISIEQRTKLHTQLSNTATATAVAITANPEIAFQKQNHPLQHRPQLQNSSLQSILFLLLIILHIVTASLSEAVASAAVTSSNRFTEQEIELLRKAFLKKFGMKEQPKQTKHTLPVPNYMWNIYENVQSEDVEWVRHYYPHSIIESDERTLLLQYDLAVTVQNESNERVMRSELKLKLSKENCRRHIKIYEIDQRNAEIWRLLDAKFIENDSRDHQWVDMDVTEAVRRRRPDMNRVNFAVQLSGDHLAVNPSASSQPSTFFTLPHDRKQTAALVVYVQSLDDSAKVRRKRKANTRRRHQHKKHGHKSAERNYCRRTELLVNFNELNWQDWILAPSSYSAYQCQGECPNPLTSHFNTTNHAIVQSLINSVDPSLVPAPCCVPTEMESLAILYIDVEGKIVIKNYPDMEVLSCGCR